LSAIKISSQFLKSGIDFKNEAFFSVLHSPPSYYPVV